MTGIKGGIVMRSGIGSTAFRVNWHVALPSNNKSGGIIVMIIWAV
jgi:hypothetical protein